MLAGGRKSSFAYICIFMNKLGIVKHLESLAISTPRSSGHRQRSAQADGGGIAPLVASGDVSPFEPQSHVCKFGDVVIVVDFCSQHRSCAWGPARVGRARGTGAGLRFSRAGRLPGAREDGRREENHQNRGCEIRPGCRSLQSLMM